MRGVRASLVAILCLGCASSPWQSTERVAGGRLYVPKVYAPLLPGSIYPNKKIPVPASGRPALVVVCPRRGDCREKALLDQAAQRGMVVLVTKDRGADVARRSEIDARRVGTLIVAAASLKVLAPPAPTADTLPSSPSKKSSVLLATLHTADPLPTDDATILKLYSPNEKGLLPKEAFRDAVEWLAGELGTR